MAKLRAKILRQSTDDYLAQVHSALIDGSNARVASARLGTTAYATHRKLYNLRLQYLSRLQKNVAIDITAAREPITAPVSQ